MPAQGRFTVLWLLLPAAACCQQVSLTLAGGSGTPGSTVSLDLSIASRQASPAAVQWTMSYWPVDVTSIQASAGAAATAAGKSLTCSSTPGAYKCIVAGVNDNPIADGVIAHFALQLAPSTPDAVSSVRIANALAAASNASAIPVETGVTDIGIEQPPRPSGFSCAPTSFVTPGSTACTLTLSAPAPAGGVTVPLVSSSPSLTVPSSINVPAGASGAAFNASASPVKAATLASFNAGPLTGTLVLAPPGGTMSIAAILNAADFATTTVAPGEIVTLLGLGLGPAQGVGFQLQGGIVPTTLSGTEVLFDGKPAPVLFASATQINAVVPNSVRVPSTQLAVQYNGASSSPLSVPVAQASPGIFTLSSSGAGQGAILNQDGSVNSPANPAAPDSIVMVYATGGGATNPPSVDGAITGTTTLLHTANSASVRIGGIDALVTYAGAAPGIVAGALQVNVKIPPEVTPGPNVPVTLAIAGFASRPGVSLAIQ